MSDVPSHGRDDYQLAELKRTITGPDSDSQNPQRAEDALQEPFSRESAVVKETQYILLQLVSMVRENSILYDDDLQATISEGQLKRQKREAWDRIRADMMWQDMTPVQDVWSELLEQYARRPEDIPDNLLEAMRWIDSYISKKKVDSRPPSQMNNMSSSLDKDFFGDVPLSEDVLVSGQNIESPPSSLNMIRDYVVIQPSRRVGEIDADSSRPSSSIQTSSPRYARRKSIEPRETEAVVRTYPLTSKGVMINSRPNNVHSQELKIAKAPLRIMKKDYKEDIPQMNYGRSGVLVEVEHGYPSSSQKVYKIVNAQRTTQPQATATVTQGRRLLGMHRGSSFSYEAVPPEPIIESPDNPVEPPKKKLVIDDLRHPRTVSMSGPIQSKLRIGESAVSIHVDQRSSDKLITEGVPIVDDEIILGAEEECKPMIGPDLLINRQTSRSVTQHDMASQNMQSTSTDDMHHYHHQGIEDGGVVEDMGQQVVVEQGDVMAMQSMQAIQYDEDLAFQQHINSVLNRLNDDEKALMKFNMQKIILDARFGAGTARSMIKDDELLEVQEHVEIEPVEESNNSEL